MAASSHIENNTEDRQVLENLSKIAVENADILLIGPSDLDKERYARHIHEHSPRRKAAFVPVDRRTVADSLETALFGNASEVFNGTQTQRGGLIAAAEGGTLFLDDIDSLTLSSQVLLLRFLQDKEYRQPSETRIRRANVRVIAATNTDLLAAVRDGRFRQDLFDCLTCVQRDCPAEPCELPLPNGEVDEAVATARLPEREAEGAVMTIPSPDPDESVVTTSLPNVEPNEAVVTMPLPERELEGPVIITASPDTGEVVVILPLPNGEADEAVVTAPQVKEITRPDARLLWPYGVLSALFFVPTMWVVFVGLVILIRQEIYWPDSAVNHLVLWGVGIISVIPLALVILDAVLRNKGKGNVNGTGGG